LLPRSEECQVDAPLTAQLRRCRRRANRAENLEGDAALAIGEADQIPGKRRLARIPRRFLSGRNPGHEDLSTRLGENAAASGQKRKNKSQFSHSNLLAHRLPPTGTVTTRSTRASSPLGITRL